MKAINIVALMALAVVILPAGVYAACDYAVPDAGATKPCPAVTTPTEAASPLAGAGPVRSMGIPANESTISPMAQCGAQCDAGQTPTGWPYTVNDEYWLRPYTNL